LGWFSRGLAFQQSGPSHQTSEIHKQKVAWLFYLLVRVTSIEVKRYNIYSPEALSILSVLVLQSEETPNGPPK
jgi:hypothetical protein